METRQNKAIDAMSYNIFRFVCILMFYVACISCKQDKIHVIEIAGEVWKLPSTIGEAVKNHQLDYRSPAYYYKTNESVEVIVDPVTSFWDTDNEYQPRETLYDNVISSYIFRFPPSQAIYDSLRASIELKYNKKFVLTKGRKDSEFLPESEMKFAYDLLTIDEKLIIGIHKNKSLVVVRFFYDMPVSKIGVYMGSYLSK